MQHSQSCNCFMAIWRLTMPSGQGLQEWHARPQKLPKGVLVQMQLPSQALKLHQYCNPRSSPCSCGVRHDWRPCLDVSRKAVCLL
jgi:hypothetical protein